MDQHELSYLDRDAADFRVAGNCHRLARSRAMSLMETPSWGKAGIQPVSSSPVSGLVSLQAHRGWVRGRVGRSSAEEEEWGKGMVIRQGGPVIESEELCEWGPAGWKIARSSPRRRSISVSGQFRTWQPDGFPSPPPHLSPALSLFLFSPHKFFSFPALPQLSLPWIIKPRKDECWSSLACRDHHLGKQDEVSKWFFSRLCCDVDMAQLAGASSSPKAAAPGKGKAEGEQKLPTPQICSSHPPLAEAAIPSFTLSTCPYLCWRFTPLY